MKKVETNSKIFQKSKESCEKETLIKYIAIVYFMVE